MGLDMHLIRAPRLDDVTIQQIKATEGWFSYENRPEEYKSSTLEEWCGVSRDDLPSKKSWKRFVRTMSSDSPVGTPVFEL